MQENLLDIHEEIVKHVARIEDSILPKEGVLGSCWQCSHSLLTHTKGRGEVPSTTWWIRRLETWRGFSPHA